MTEPKKTDQEIKLLAAMAYAEASSDNVAEEMSALASVLVRKKDARGYPSISTFASTDRIFSFVVKDGNEGYRRLVNASEAQLEDDAGMSAAVAGARNALAGGPDLSNGAYFWDGADIRSNYKRHFKVRNGIKFSQPSHNIYAIPESAKLIVLTRTIVKKSKGKVISTETVEVGRYDTCTCRRQPSAGQFSGRIIRNT